MPTKRRGQKSRFIAPWGATFTETKLWSCVFSLGFDGLHLLDVVGKVETDNMRPPRELTLDAWRRLGADWLASRPDDKPEAPWALREFGRPWEDNQLDSEGTAQ